MKAIKLQSGNKLHHYWLSQYIKAIVLHQREFEFEYWPIRKFHFIQPGPVPSTILNYCPIRWLLFHLPSWILVQSQAELPSWIIVQSEDCFPSAILHFWPIRDELLPPMAYNSHFYTTRPLPNKCSLFYSDFWWGQGYPIHSWTGGIPFSPGWGVGNQPSHDWGYPNQSWRPWVGYPPHLDLGWGTPWSRPGYGVPPSGTGMGYHPPPLAGWSTPISWMGVPPLARWGTPTPRKSEWIDAQGVLPTPWHCG